MPTPGSQAQSAARERGGVPAVGAGSMARGPRRSGRPRIPGSRLRAQCALCTLRSRRRQQRLPFRLRICSRSGSSGRRVPAASSVCRGAAAASLPPSGARSLHGGNHGDRAHPSRAASLKRQASHRGIPHPSGPRWGRGGGGPPTTDTGTPQTAPSARSRSGYLAAGARRLSRQQGVLREPHSLSSPGGT